MSVGEVLRRKHESGEMPPLVTVRAHDKVRDAVALLHEHGVSQLPVVSSHDEQAVVGSVGERGLLTHAVADSSLLNADVIDVMEPPFPAVAADDSATDAVAVLAGERDALLVTVDGRAAGVVTRADLLEALARVTTFATRAVHAGLEPDPDVSARSSRRSTRPRPTRSRSRGSSSRTSTTRAARTPRGRRSRRRSASSRAGSGSAFSSGMAATHALLTAATNAGDHVILPDDLYGGTYRLVDKVLSRFGLAYDMVDQTDPANVAAALRPETKVIWVETPTNPLLNVVDVEAIVAGKGDALVAVDNTFATPAIQRPLELGADAVVHSTTKYLGGHSDVVGGAVIVKDPALHEQVRFVQNAVGAVPGPFDCFLVHRGLRTLHLRVKAHTENARAVVRCSRPRGSRTSAGRASAAWSPSATPTRSASRRGPSSSRSPSRSAASSRSSRSRRR